ncbi:MAG: DMT family transporter [Chloroflexota bacterium]
MAQSSPPTSTPNSLLENTPFVISMLLLFDSMHLILARWLSNTLHPLASAFWVLFIATVQFAIYLVAVGRLEFQIFRQHVWFFAIVGFLVAVATSMNYTAVTYVDAGTAGLLGRSSTIFSIAFGVLWLKDRLTMWQWVGAAVAILGVIGISFQPIDSLQIGALFVLGSSFTYSLHAAVVKRYGSEMDFVNFMLFRVGATAFFIFSFILLAPVAGENVRFWPTSFEWFALIVTATVDVVLSRIFYYWSLRKVEMSYHSIILMLAPVVTIFWSLLFFRETPSWQSVIGGAVVIAGLVIVNWENVRRRLSAVDRTTAST